MAQRNQSEVPVRSDGLPRDVSGRALALRDVDLDAFLHPRTIALTLGLEF